METDADVEYKPLVEGILKKSQSLLGLVESMGPNLTDSDVDVRRKALQVLAAVVAHLPSDLLNTIEIQTLVDFFSARFLDHHSLIPCSLMAFKALSVQKALSGQEALLIADQLVNNHHFQVQSIRQSERMTVFLTLTNLFAFHDLSKMCRDPGAKPVEDSSLSKAITPNELLYGFIQSIEGEKDPRNLLLVFDLATIFASTFTLSQLGDDLFSVIACYFPIDYVPPTKMNQQTEPVTPSQLREKLRKFFAANPAAFHKECLPLVIEKLTSSLAASRVESADALKECAKTYPAECFKDHLIILWDSLQSEMFNPLAFSSSSSFERNSFGLALSAVVAKISESEAVYSSFSKVSTVQLDRFVAEKNLRFAKQSARCICSILQGLLEVNQVGKAETVLNRYIVKYIDLYMTPASEEEEEEEIGAISSKQRRLIVLQSIDQVLSVEPSSNILNGKTADDLMSLLLSSISNTILLESGSESSTVSDTSICALKIIGSVPKWMPDTCCQMLIEKAIDRILDLALTTNSDNQMSEPCQRECVRSIHHLVQAKSGDNVASINRTITFLEENDTNFQICFDLVTAFCCTDSDSDLECFSKKCVEWKIKSDQFDLLLDHSFGPLLVILQKRQKDAKQFLTSFLADRVILSRFLSKQTSSERFRQLAAILLEWQYILSIFDEEKLSAGDVVNVLAFVQLKDKAKTSRNEQEICLKIARTVFQEIGGMDVDPSLDFLFNLAAFLAKFIEVNSLHEMETEMLAFNSESSNLARCQVVLAFTIFVSSSPKWTTSIEKLLASLLRSDENISLAFTTTFGNLFSLSQSEIGETHPRRLFTSKVSTLKRQALVSKMSTPLSDNVKSGNHVVTCLTMLTDLTRILPGKEVNAKSLLEPVLPSVIDQLSKFPADRLGQVLTLMSDHLRAVLSIEPQNEAHRLLETLLTCINSTLRYEKPDEDEENESLSSSKPKFGLQARLASVSLLLHLAELTDEFPLLLGPLQKRISHLLQPCLSDHKRLVRAAAARAINKWACST